MYNLFHYRIIWIGLLLGLFALGWVLPAHCEDESDYEVEIFSYSYTIPSNPSDKKVCELKMEEKNASLSKIIIYCVIRDTQSYGIRLGSAGRQRLEEWVEQKSDYEKFREILMGNSEDIYYLQQAIGIENLDGKWGPNTWYRFREFLTDKLKGKESEIIPFRYRFKAKVIDLNKFIGDTPSGKKAELRDILEEGIIPQLLHPQFAKRVKDLYESASSKPAQVGLSEYPQTTTTSKEEEKPESPNLLIIFAVIVIAFIFIFGSLWLKQNKRKDEKSDEWISEPEEEKSKVKKPSASLSKFVWIGLLLILCMFGGICGYLSRNWSLQTRIIVLVILGIIGIGILFIRHFYRLTQIKEKVEELKLLVARKFDSKIRTLVQNLSLKDYLMNKYEQDKLQAPLISIRYTNYPEFEEEVNELKGRFSQLEEKLDILESFL